VPERASDGWDYGPQLRSVPEQHVFLTDFTPTLVFLDLDAGQYWGNLIATVNIRVIRLLRGVSSVI
jgi:hypothetical protein